MTEIADMARRAGAKVPFLRSERTANDYATTADVVDEVLCAYEAAGMHFDRVCCMYPTAPFVTAKAIRTAMLLLDEKKADCVIPVVKFSFPPQRGVLVQDGRIVPKWKECMNMRSQDLEPLYHDCGQFYCLNVESFRKQKAIWMENAVPFVQDEMTVQDIDTPEDWEIAEMKYRILYGDKGAQRR